MVQQLQSEVQQLQNHTTSGQGAAPSVHTESTSVEAAPTQMSSTTTGSQPGTQQPVSEKAPDPLHGTTVNFLFDGYYDHNFNSPIGRDSLLRAYDVISDAFSLNQADVVLENAQSPTEGKRYGARLDLQFGQATETLQGNSANEPRPDVYRNIFQAYGTYVFPVRQGLTN
jgi:hypothetical protein